ncbi:winged helix-turn-helix domain-containing protein [Dokdonella sp.]|uniref:winged helix-turn-helix domain-containing protein n=1 Tax=Dokdonella sp. TaxID=2291710 RepID=UPI001B151C40|nr:winged helix-turn-helix domain-containing protein [Dokdonella sp.]MBO9664389.1 winged helix-turn-helix domain-containing protein [Dokdonella sp.]
MEQQEPAAYRCGDYTIVPAERRLLRGADALDLEAKVFDLILLLLRNRERSLDKQTLAAALWGRRPVTDAALSQLVHKARRALDDDGDRQAMIRTVYGRGLQWVAPTEAVWPTAPEPTPGATPVADTDAPPQARAPSRRRFFFAASIALVVVVALLFALRRHESSSTLPRLAMLPIENATGEAALDWTRSGLPGLMSSLLGESGAVDVGDTLQIAKAWDYLPIPGRSQAERLRYATGAAILVEGRLRRLSDQLYELSLHVDGGDAAHSGELVLTAAQPATLGVDAVPRILRLLKREPAADAATERGLGGDAYLAQTFARGVDLAMHGDWENAKPYFALCVQNAPDFLPARLRLGQAQASTRDLGASEATLRALVDEARRRQLPAMEAAALLELAENEFRRGDRSAALALLEQARAPAERGSDPDAQARLALLAARAHAILRQPELAAENLARGRALVERHALRQRAPLLHYAEELIAGERRDYPAQEAAARAALAAAEAIGDEHMAIAETYRIGRMQSWQERPFAALPPLARAWQRARERKLLDIETLAGVELAWVLSETGRYAEACAVVGTLIAELQSQPNAYWKAIALAARARCQRAGGEAKAALATYRAVRPLVNPREDPALDALVSQYEALAAFVAERGALPAIQAQLAAAGDGASYLHVRRLVDALAAAARGDLAAAAAKLEEESADPDRDDGQGNELRRFALHVALATPDERAAEPIARIAQRREDILSSNDVEVLRLYAEWSARRGDTATRARAEARIDELRREAATALHGVDVTLPSAPAD